ncbi:MAG TPA: hypothetical protein VEA19_01855, partial [Actinomycetota bacterium]|nr:hypothetical protein [Actinomycetota bacterium]
MNPDERGTVHGPGRHRRRAIVVLAWATIGIGACAALAAPPAIAMRDEVDAGGRLLARGRSMMTRGEAGTAAEAFKAAERAFVRAGRNLDAV